MPRPTTLPEPWRTLADALGGVRALADALGVKSTSTVGRYARGEIKPSGAVLILFGQLCKQYGIKGEL